MKKIALILVPILLAACASTPMTDTPPTPQAREAVTKPPVVDNSEAIEANRRMLEANRKLEEARLLEESRKLQYEAQDLQKQSVFFDFDRYVVKPEYQGVVQRQAEFIKMHRNDIVTLEGNADERGSNEYNLALGDKRANAVQKDLELLGVPATQIRAVSMGEEKARLSCHEEKCWKENRRDDFFHKLN
ncbi:MAG: OmpA family protein [Gallionella sp.]|nr:OmpA family protein [Gallionella sp.]